MTELSLATFSAQGTGHDQRRRILQLLEQAQLDPSITDRGPGLRDGSTLTACLT